MAADVDRKLRLYTIPARNDRMSVSLGTQKWLQGSNGYTRWY